MTPREAEAIIDLVRAWQRHGETIAAASRIADDIESAEEELRKAAAIAEKA